MIIDRNNIADFGLLYDKDNKVHNYCAKQINKYLKKCCGFTLKDYSSNKNFISLGYNVKSKDLIDVADKSTLKRSGLRIVFREGNIYIYGGSDTGLIYGVFEFVERYLGVKFLTSVDEITPSLSQIFIDETDVECNPCFDQRDCAHFSFMVNPEYVLKRRFESPNTPDFEELGIINNVWHNEIPNSHNSFYYVNREKYIKTNPELFCAPNPEKGIFKDAKGVDDIFAELCYSNGVTDDGKVDDSLEISAVKIVADSLYNYIINNPTKKYFMFGRQDNGGAICYCEKCVEKRKRYGGEAGTMIIFLNAVIDLVEKRLIKEGKTPDFNLATFAYQSTIDAPVDEEFKPIDNLIIPHKRLHIRYAPLNKNFSYSNTDVRQDEDVRKALKGWSSLTSNLMIWDYSMEYIDKLFFFPVYLYLAEDIKLYSQIGVSYLMYEEAYGSTQGYMIEMDSYVMSKLFWNPNLNARDLMKEYIENYYGIAWKSVYDFRCKMLDFFKNKIETESDFRICPVDPWSKILQPETYPLEFLTDCVNILDTGLDIISNSKLTLSEKEILSNRIKNVLLSPLRMIVKNKEYYFGDKPCEYENRFYMLVVETGYQLAYSPLEIIKANQPNYKIMVDKTNQEDLEIAEYLNEWFKNKTGVELEFVNYSECYPTYAVKVISIGSHAFAQEFFKRTDFDKYKVFVKTCGWSVFIAGKDMISACDLFVSRIKDKTWCEGYRRLTSLELSITEIVEYKK